MQSDEREKHWERMYRENAPGEVGWYQPKPTVSLELIDSLGLARNARIIDVGGGRSRLVDCLLERGFSKLTVCDISDAALTASRERLGDRADEIDWRKGDILESDLAGPFDVWHDRAVYHFLTDRQSRRRYIEQLNDALVEGGHVVLAMFTTEAPEKCSGLPVNRQDPDAFSDVLGDGFELAEQREETHFTPGGVRQPYVYGIFRRS
jgi:SAM-dependent methyltransferase